MDSGLPSVRAQLDRSNPGSRTNPVMKATGGMTRSSTTVLMVMLPVPATAAASISGYLQRTSTAGTGGTAVNPTIAKLDTTSPTATAVVTHYTTAAQSVGTTTSMGGPLSQFVVGMPIVSVPTVSILNQMQMLFPEVGQPIGQAIVVRGTSEYINVINTTPANFANAVSMSYMIEWEEHPLS